ncbi:hypothetical protein PQC59_gp095 [Escherichia phage vB_EcoP_IMEP8]|uniref:Uncharacterized protein n=1 Tax=Escherichia phage vB_EcoP_IMEP8 TaxID=2866663 RepID=A0AAE8Y349_9CAUD|nr:hypothetical protein PQC59_gp095 [Escherichia phage vB_EcoP_IMEP8]UCR92016.1 hypothetical protein [Escherichia phage vB_EcoP_IMEP8]
MKITKRVDRVPLESLENGAVFKHPDSDTLYVKGFVHGTPNVSVNSGRTLALRLHDGLVTAPDSTCQVVPVSAELLVSNV